MGDQRRCSSQARRYRLREFALLIPQIYFDHNRQAYLYLINQNRSTWTWELDRELAWLLILGNFIVLI